MPDWTKSMQQSFEYYIVDNELFVPVCFWRIVLSK